MIVTCVRCSRARKHHGRGLCAGCRAACLREGTLTDYPRTLLTPAETAEDVADVFASTRDLDTIAARLRRTPASIVRALERHRAALVADGAAADRLRAVDAVLVPLRAQLWQQRYPTRAAA